MSAKAQDIERAIQKLVAEGIAGERISVERTLPRLGSCTSIACWWGWKSLFGGASQCLRRGTRLRRSTRERSFEVSNDDFAHFQHCLHGAIGLVAVGVP